MSFPRVTLEEGASLQPISIYPQAPLTPGPILIAAALEAIQDDQDQVLQLILDQLPLRDLPDRELFQLLNQLLRTAATYHRPEIIRGLITRWAKLFPSEETNGLELPTRLLMEPLIEVEGLRFAFSLLPEVTFLDSLDQLSQQGDTFEGAIACQRAFDVFGTPSVDTLEAALASAQAIGATRIAAVLAEAYVKVAPFAPYPTWVADFRDVPAGTPLPTEQDLQREIHVMVPTEEVLPDPEAAAQILTDGLASLGITVDDIEKTRHLIRAQLQSSSADQLRTLLREAMTKEELASLQDDVQLYRILGPSNPLYDATIDEMTDGGCRMLTCTVFDYDEDDQESYDWYEGWCEWCYHRLRTRGHALRIPGAYGGWHGCYCSWSCIRQALTRQEELNLEPQLVVRTMVANLEQRFSTDKLQDRRAEVKTP